MIRNQRQMNAAAKAAEGYLGRTAEYQGRSYSFVGLAPSGWWGLDETGSEFQQFSDAGLAMGGPYGSTKTRGALADLGARASVVLHADTAYGISESLPGHDNRNDELWLGHRVTQAWWRKAHAAAVVEHAVHRVLSLEEIAAGKRPEPLF